LKLALDRWDKERTPAASEAIERTLWRALAAERRWLRQNGVGESASSTLVP
jgi:hypothetical protein